MSHLGPNDGLLHRTREAEELRPGALGRLGRLLPRTLMSYLNLSRRAGTTRVQTSRSTMAPETPFLADVMIL